MSVRAGTRLEGRYRLSERIAVGGMGEVWRGTDEVLGRSVAVKILRAELAEDEAFRKRFRAEARVAGSLPHSGIAQVFDYGETTVGPDGVSPSSTPVQGDGIAFLVMELVPGEALSALLARDGALGTERTLSLVSQAARALHAAHTRGVVHRDVKPANLMITPESRVKVTDFGIARPVDHEPLTMTGQVMGTAHYLAPELARGLEASPLSDVYALGVVAYECLAGHRPFEGDNQVLVATAHLNQQPPPLPGTVPDDVVRAVGAAMEKNPNDRIRSAEAFAVALEKLLVHDPTALDDIGGSGHDLHNAQAPSFGPDGQVIVPRRGAGGRHSAPAGSVPDTVAAPGFAAPGMAGMAGTAGAGTTVQNPASGGWRPVPTAPHGVPRAPDGGPGAGGPGGPGDQDYYRLGPEPGRRREQKSALSPALLLILGLIGLIVVIAVVIRLTGGSPGGTVDIGGDPSPSVTVPQGSTSPTTGPSSSASVTPSGSATPSRTRRPSATPTPSSTSARPSSPAATSAPPSTPPATTPPATTPPPTTPPATSPAASTEPSAPASVSVSPQSLRQGGLTGVAGQG